MAHGGNSLERHADDSPAPRAGPGGGRGPRADAGAHKQRPWVGGDARGDAGSRGRAFASRLGGGRTELECRAGNWRRADRYAAEAMEITLEAGIQEATPGPLSRLALVEALTGRIEDARAHASEGLKVAEPCQDTWAVIRNRSVLGFLELSLGNPAGARDALAPLPGVLEEIGVAEPGAFPLIPDLVEALVVVGKLVEASTLAEGLEERGRALDRALALATAARWRGSRARPSVGRARTTRSSLRAGANPPGDGRGP